MRKNENITSNFTSHEVGGAIAELVREPRAEIELLVQEEGFRLTEVGDTSPENARQLSLVPSPYEFTEAQVGKGDGMWLVDHEAKSISHYKNVSCGAKDRGSKVAEKILERFGFESDEKQVAMVTEIGRKACRFTREPRNSLERVDFLVEQEGFRLQEAGDKNPRHALSNSYLLKNDIEWNEAIISKDNGLWLVASDNKAIVHFANFSCGSDDDGARFAREMLENRRFDSEPNPLSAITDEIGLQECRFVRELQ